MNDDKEMTLVSLDLPDRLLAFLALYAHENDMKIQEAINTILADYIQNYGDILNVPKTPTKKV